MIKNDFLDFCHHRQINTYERRTVAPVFFFQSLAEGILDIEDEHIGILEKVDGRL